MGSLLSKTRSSRCYKLKNNGVRYPVYKKSENYDNIPEMLMNMAALLNPSGSSVQGILNYLEMMHQLEGKTVFPYVQKFLENGLNTGIIEQVVEPESVDNRKKYRIVKDAIKKRGNDPIREPAAVLSCPGCKGTTAGTPYSGFFIVTNCGHILCDRCYQTLKATPPRGCPICKESSKNDFYTEIHL